MNTEKDNADPDENGALDDVTNTIQPPDIVPLHTAGTAQDRCRVTGEHASLWFEPAHADTHGDNLIVTFDNLATIDEGFPRTPWLWRRLEPLGHAVLGVQSHTKNWFRAPTAPMMLRALEEQGFFARYKQVVLIGASMGGFAAINFAPLIPNSRVIAFSAQSTMNQVIAPYEKRFPWAVRNSNWEGMPFLDAAAAIPYIRNVVLLYDPFASEDAQHARRMVGANVQQVHCDHCTHEAIRVVLKADALPVLIEDVIRQGHAGTGFFHALRGRRTVMKWQRALLSNLATKGKHSRVIHAANLIEKAMPEGTNLMFLRQLRRASRAAMAG